MSQAQQARPRVTREGCLDRAGLCHDVFSLQIENDGYFLNTTVISHTKITDGVLSVISHNVHRDQRQLRAHTDFCPDFPVAVSL